MPAVSDNFIIRELQVEDYDKGYLQVMGELTTVGKVTKEQFRGQFDRMPRSAYRQFVIAESGESGRVVGAGTLLIELKFIHECGCAGHIEDIVIGAEMRGKNLGKRLVGRLLEEAKSMGCYKVILDCKVDNLAFYAKCGFVEKERQMALYFAH